MSDDTKSLIFGVLIGIYWTVKFFRFVNKKANEEIYREFNNSPLGQLIPRR